MTHARVGAVLEGEVWAKDKEGLFWDQYQMPVSFRATPGNVVAVSELAEPILEALNGGTVDELRRRTRACSPAPAASAAAGY
jgi:hypothetical protein